MNVLYVVYNNFTNEIIDIYEDKNNAKDVVNSLHENNGMNDFIIKETFLHKSQNSNLLDYTGLDEQDYNDMIIDLENKLKDAKDELLLVNNKYNILRNEYINDLYYTSYVMFGVCIIILYIMYINQYNP